MLDAPAGRDGFIRLFETRARAAQPSGLLCRRTEKKRGIYSDLNLNVGRKYQAGDGVPDYRLIGVAKGMTYFGDRLLELRRD